MYEIKKQFNELLSLPYIKDNNKLTELGTFCVSVVLISLGLRFIDYLYKKD